jgi:hypothetical protein
LVSVVEFHLRNHGYGNYSYDNPDTKQKQWRVLCVDNLAEITLAR